MERRVAELGWKVVVECGCAGLGGRWGVVAGRRVAVARGWRLLAAVGRRMVECGGWLWAELLPGGGWLFWTAPLAPAGANDWPPSAEAASLAAGAAGSGRAALIIEHLPLHLFQVNDVPSLTFCGSYVHHLQKAIVFQALFDGWG